MKSGYNIYHIVYVFILLDFMVLRAIDIKYVSKIFPPDSILENKEDYKPLSVYGRQRYATTTGVTFLFDDNYLATVSLLGNILSLYKFDKQSGKVSFLKKLSNHSALEIFNSENLVVSYDNKLLAIAGCPPSPGIKV